MPNKQLVVIQATPFCNINCRYCYLPERSNREQASRVVLDCILSQTLASQLLQEPITYVWHAGEPLALPPSYYHDAFSLARTINQQYRRAYTHSIQTNGMLITDEYVALFREFGVRLGVSLDGPAFVHDRQRVTRAGKGTHEQVMRGVRKLQQAGHPFGVISVLTRDSLDHADEIFDFFADHGITEIAFNIDEIQGTYGSSSHQAVDAVTAYRTFMRRFLERTQSSNGRLHVREFRQVYQQVLSGEVPRGGMVNSTNCPLQILNFDYQGNYWTFSPELSGVKSARFHDFVMGNVLTDPIDRIFDHPIFQLVNGEIQAGVELCRRTCPYWDVCGGGTPAAKFFEHGRFNVAETLTCRIHTKELTNVILDYLEARLECHGQ